MIGPSSHRWLTFRALPHRITTVSAWDIDVDLEKRGITQLLWRWRDGDRQNDDALARELYPLLHEIARAQLVSDRTGTPTGFKVFYLRYAWAQDVNIAFGGRQVMLPGVAMLARLSVGMAPLSTAMVSEKSPISSPVAPLLEPAIG